jgi:hypothetical protein
VPEVPVLTGGLVLWRCAVLCCAVLCCAVLSARLYAISRCPHLKILDWKKVKQKVRGGPAVFGSLSALICGLCGLR